MSNIDDEYSTKPASDSEEDHPNFDDPSCFIPEGLSLPSQRTTAPLLRCQGPLKKNIMKFVIDRKKLGLAEEIYGLRIIKQHKNHRNLLMYPVAGV